MGLKIIKSDSLAVGERWVQYQGDVEFKIAGIDCSEYQIALERARRLIARADAGQSLADITVGTGDRSEHDIQCALLGKYIVRDWKGSVEDESGKPVQYSPEAAALLLKSHVDLFVWIMRESSRISADERKEAAETVEKP